MTGSLVRSVWKTIQSSDDPFILQRNDTALMAYEEAVNSEGGTNTTNPTATVTATTTSSGTNAKRRTTITTSTNSTHSNHSGTNGTSNHPVSATIHTSPRNPIYRIITRNFPHYRVAEAIEWNDILEDLEQLQQTVLPRVEGKLTSKKVVKWLRNWHSHGESILPPLLKHSINQHDIMDINQSATHLKQAHQLNEVDETGYASSSESSLDDEEEEENRYSSGTPVPTYAKHTKTPLLLVRSPTIPVNKQGEEEEEESLDAPMDRTHSTTSLGIPLDPHDPTRTDSDQCERLSSSVPLSKSTSKQHKRSWSAGSYEPASANTTTATTTTTSAIPMALNASQSPSLTPQHTMNHGKTRVYPKYPPLPPPTTSTSTATTKKSTTTATNHGMTLASHSSSNDPSQDTSLWDTLESYTRWVASADNGADVYLSPGRPSMDTDIMEDDFNASNLLSPSSAANGNATTTQGSTGRKRAQSTPANLTSPLASVGIEQLWEFPLQFVALLSMPETDGRPSYQTLRDMAQVRQRRRVLFYFTLFILLVRYCSFDLFILVLFASNCGMLFLMKNSRRVNMTLAKRSVRQRVNWAKQWMGGLIKHRGNNNNSNANGNLVNNQPELATLPPTPVTATAPTHPSVTSSTVTSTATTTSTATSPCVGSKATAVRRKLRLRGRNSDAATTAASVGVVVTRLEEEAANMTNGSISDSSPPNKRSTARNSFASAIVEDTSSTSSLPDTSNTNSTTTTTTTSTSTTGVARQVVASATSATAKRLSFFRTRSPSNATDKTNSTANNNPLPPSSLSSSTTPSNSSNSSGNTTTTTTSNGTSYHPMSEMPPSPNITSPMALAMATANAAAIIASPHIYQHHQHQHHRSHSAAASVVANHEATTAATVTTGTRRRFLFGRSTPSNTTTTTSSSNTSNGTVQETMAVDTQHTSHSTTTTTSTNNNLVTTKNISSNTSLPSLVSAQ
ncbi:hypothetical protein BDF22DRAFT_744669 [Syncephalis plumigaleata]|nr:hypothetical protein BDF22DRAFT_744669 [Syncephalis plumigaleata]